MGWQGFHNMYCSQGYSFIALSVYISPNIKFTISDVFFIDACIFIVFYYSTLFLHFWFINAFNQDDNLNTYSMKIICT